MLGETPEVRSEVGGVGLELLHVATGHTVERLHLGASGLVLAASDDPDRAGKGVEGRKRPALRYQDARPGSGQTAGAAEEAILIELMEASDNGVEIGVRLRVGEEKPGLPAHVK